MLMAPVLVCARSDMTWEGFLGGGNHSNGPDHMGMGQLVQKGRPWLVDVASPLQWLGAGSPNCALLDC